MHCRTPAIEEPLITKIEPSNPVEKYAVSVNKDNLIIGYWQLSKNESF